MSSPPPRNHKITNCPSFITRVSLRFEKEHKNIDSFRGFIEKISLFLNRSEALLTAIKSQNCQPLPTSQISAKETLKASTFTPAKWGNVERMASSISIGGYPRKDSSSDPALGCAGKYDMERLWNKKSPNSNKRGLGTTNKDHASYIFSAWRGKPPLRTKAAFRSWSSIFWGGGGKMGKCMKLKQSPNSNTWGQTTKQIKPRWSKIGKFRYETKKPASNTRGLRTAKQTKTRPVAFATPHPITPAEG